MQRLGFIHDMLDVKVLILFVTARANYPMSLQEIYENCYVDDCLSYFDVCTAIPEMVETGHLKEVEAGKYVITDQGREDGELIEHYRQLGELRSRYRCLADGDFDFIYCQNGLVAYRRRGEKDSLTVYINTTGEAATLDGVKIEGKSFKII